MKSALDAALAYLSRRSLTRYELEQRLLKKGYSSDDIEGALKRVSEWGYLNDREYAYAYIRTKQVNYSKKRIEVELKRRGLEEELIEETLQEVYLPKQEKELCMRHAQRIWAEEFRRWESSYQYKKSYLTIPRNTVLRQKVGQKLLQKGYPLELIYQVVEEIMGRE